MSDPVVDLADILGVLGHPHRLRLVLLLTGGPRYAGPLAEAAGLSPALAAHHLGLLARAGVIVRTARGRQAEYSLATDALDLALDVARRWVVDGQDLPVVRAEEPAGEADTPAARLRRAGRPIPRTI